MNEITRNNGNLLGVKSVYERLSEPLESLSSKEQVMTIANGIPNLRKSLDKLVEMFKDRAVNEQKNIIKSKDEEVQSDYEELERARKTKDYNLYDQVGGKLITSLAIAKGTVYDLRLLEKGDFETYIDNKKMIENGGDMP